MTLSGANAAASAGAQRGNVSMVDIIGDDSILLRDASWRRVPCVTKYDTTVLEVS